MVFSSVGISFAEDDVNVDVRNDITNNNNANATANATANQSQNQSQTQTQLQNQQQKLVNNFVVPIQPYSFDTPVPMSAGQAAANSAWMLYMPLVLDCLTIEEAAEMSNGFFWNRIEVVLKKKGLAATGSIQILDYYGKKKNDVVVGFARVFGKKRDINESLIALAAKEGMKSGATGMSIMIRVKNRTNSKGLSFGAGAGAGLSIPCNNGVGTGISFGAYLSSVAIEDEIELTVLYLIVGPPEAPCPPPAPPEVKKPEPPCPPQEPPCDLTKIWERIHELEREVQKCTRYCFNNLKLRYALEKEYIELYVCTKETRYLDSAIYNAEVAERNYRKGYDIAAHRAEADQVISEVWYLQAGAINLTRGGSVADSFAASKKLERYPKGFAR